MQMAAFFLPIRLIKNIDSVFTSPIPVRLKEARKKAKHSQKALGVRIGTIEQQQSHLSALEDKINLYKDGKVC
ncbi:hypothetical protein VEJY3_22551 [Vibrio sp. EJY3]|nr:hypothetical protein VEJY3_22551 [Vibrio sp. EJY3]